MGMVATMAAVVMVVVVVEVVVVVVVELEEGMQEMQWVAVVVAEKWCTNVIIEY